MSLISKILWLAVAVLLLVIYLAIKANPFKFAENPTGVSFSPSASASPALALFGMPISMVNRRVTKKPFGIFVSPTNSPVNPERFTGYHTGTDFEIFPGEENIDVPIYAICDGPLLEKITATGYGGVAVQKCDLNGQPITVIYGHLKLSSITVKAGQQLIKSEKLAVLGSGFSAETGGERKHLHLGIHNGSAINLRGYVQNQAELVGWINIMKVAP